MNQTAQGLAALGRGPDTMLVHMAPEEVAGLQALALKHGGTLTINPETGLAEAGFLKSILPMIAGFALGPAGFGLSSAMAGLTVGGISALTSGSLEKGLMAGLGAYGGAGLGEGFMGAGTNALSSTGANAVVPPAAESIVPQAVMPAATNVAGATPNVLGGTATELVSATAYPTVVAPTVSAIPTTTTTIAPAELISQTGPSTGDFARFDRAFSPGLGASQMDKLGAGFNAVTASPGAALEFAKANKMPLGALGIAALSGTDSEKSGGSPPNPGMIRPYTYARTKNKEAFEDVAGEPMSSRERRYFNETYTAGDPYRAPGPEYTAAEGGIVKFDVGGSVGGYTFNPRTGLYERGSASDSMYENDSIGGYMFDPRTGKYTRSAPRTITPMPTVGDFTSGFSGDSGGGGSGLPSGPIAPTTPEEFAAQSARNQQINDFLTNISKVSLTGLLSSGLVGLLGGKPQSPAPVEDVGTYFGKNPMNDFGFATQAEADAINAAAAQQEAQQQSVNQALNDLSARQETQMNAAPDTGGGYSASDYGGYSGSETQSSGEAYANFKGGLIDKVAGPNPPGPDDGAGMLQLGEYVIKKSAVKKYGAGLLDMINAGKIPAKKMKSLLG